MSDGQADIIEHAMGRITDLQAKLEAADRKLREFVWGENPDNQGDYDTMHDKNKALTDTIEGLRDGLREALGLIEGNKWPEGRCAIEEHSGKHTPPKSLSVPTFGERHELRATRKRLAELLQDTTTNTPETTP